MSGNNRIKKKQKKITKLSHTMRKKLMALFSIILLCMVGLVARLMYIERTSGEKYEKKVLSLQSYDSKTIPYQRGDIVDRTGTVLATSVAVYNVILDCSVLSSNDAYIEPTIEALVTYFPELEEDVLYDYVEEQKNNKYIVLLKKEPYEYIQPFVEHMDEVDEDGDKVNPNIKGVWFEKEYIRDYPYQTLAASVIGFTSEGNVGTIGLENYYDDVLNGVNGREFGYLNTDNDFQKTVIEPVNGYNLVTTIDMHIQSIVESKILEFNTVYANNARNGAGSLNTAVIVMNPNTGEILAMADYPTFDLNDPRNLSGIYSQEEISNMSDEDTLNILNGLWQNYCVSSTYEPGSVQKPFTIACGLEIGVLTQGMSFYCDGLEKFDGVSQPVRCVNRNGHGTEGLRETLMDSCNDSVMQMSYLIGAERFLEYQHNFGFGSKTGIDLPGEASASTLIYSLEEMKKVDLATNAFGQNYNCTMIQMTAAFSSLINGGYYYEPHLVSKIVDENNNTVSEIQPLLVKQTVSESTSMQLKSYLYSVVSEDGTGKTAKVDGYSMGGKTGTAQKYPRGNNKYLVSFVGFVPYDNPEIVIYCVVDEPNAESQDHSSYAQNISREILEEVLPYMNIYPDEELTGMNENLGITGTDALDNVR